MLAPGGEFAEASWWVSMAIESHRAYPEFVRELESESGLPIDFQACGAVETAESAESWARLTERAEKLKALGIESVAGDGNYTFPQDSWVDPRTVMAALRRVCELRGVTVLENAPVTEYQAGGEDALVIAAGAWSGGLRIVENGRVVSLPGTFPVKGHLIGYRMPPGSLTRILRRGHTYILQRSNGFTIAGSNEEKVGFERAVNAETCRDICQRAAKVWPALADRKPEETWIGFRPGSATGEPVIGRYAGSRIWMAYGHYRNGILMAPATAERIASEISG